MNGRASQLVMRKKLLMSFDTELGRTVSISVDDPRENITESEIKSAMVKIVESGVFAPYQSALIAPKDAKIVVTDETKFDLV